ncbi:hypothetical protein PENFLA_c020G01011 [Penicillium flavigenum]|uniref:Fungal N-terminal domain-containing protein n=1 Tax=Penicillium flavigenum TaxID=254877 RepID=A0A1V6SYB4_9EURO|nr:hypothetical protein PENFLA_c020G01011 [Penicillium flavigenum]
MSGLEIVGVIASTFQIAEIGIKLSVKLCSFYRQIKDADNSAQRLASDVSLTCSILHQLGKILEQDSQTKLCSQQAFLTAQEVLEECENIFNQIDEAIQKKDPGSGNRSKHDCLQKAYQPYASNGRRRHPAYKAFSKGDDIDSYDGLTPREQFDRDYPVKRHPRVRYSLDRPLGITLMDEHPHMLRKERPNQPHGPPPTWGFDKIGVRARSSQYGDSHWDTSRTRTTPRPRGGHDLAPTALPHESDDSCDTYTDKYRRRHRRNRRESDRHGGNRSPQPHNGVDKQFVAVGLGTTALDGGHSDMSDYECLRPPRRRTSRPHRHSRRRSRYRGRDSFSDASTGDEDLRKSSYEPSAADHRSIHSNADTSSAEDSPRDRPRRHRRRSHHRSSRSHRRLEDGSKDRWPHKDTRGGFWDENHHHGDTLGGKNSADGDDEKDDKKEDESMEADTPPLRQKALDVSSSKLVATSGKESPRKHVAWDTLEDLMLSWTILPRDMIWL